MTTILTKKKDTTGAPAPGDLTNAAGGAELAVNTFDKRLYTKDAGGNVVEIGTNPTILNIDNIQIDGNTISSTNSNGNINLTPNGTGSVVVSKLQVTGTFQLDGNVTVGDTSADTLTVNSTITSNLIFTDNTYDIGASGATRPRTGYFGTSVISPLFVAGAGTVSVPAFSTTGDTNTGIFFPAADTIAFTEGGVESMRIDSSGNVGIGTNSPSYRLDISANSTGTSGARIQNPNSNSGAFTTLWLDNDSAGIKSALVKNSSTNTGNTGFANSFYLYYNDTGSTGIQNVSATPIQFITNNTERMRIDSSGNVGIGTSSPDQKLVVVGNIQSGSTGSNGTFHLGGPNVSLRSAYAANVLGIYTSNTEQVRIDSSGNVGIGTSSPLFRLVAQDASSATRVHVVNTANAAGGAGIYFQVFNGVTEQSGVTIRADNADNLAFFNKVGERMRITSGGDVAIGRTSTNGRLSIQTAGGATNAIDLYSPSTTNGARIQLNDNLYSVAIYSIPTAGASSLGFEASGAERMRIDSSGNVGIGTSSPTAYTGGTRVLQVTGSGDTDLKLTTSSTGSGATDGLLIRINSTGSESYFWNSENGAVVLGTNNAERMRITSGGILMVGKTNTDSATNGLYVNPASGGFFHLVVTHTTSDTNAAVQYLNRQNSDGVLIEFRQADINEGTISVSGTTVSYNGGHLSRWAQTIGAKDDSLLKGTVMSNLDEMNEYVDAKGNPVDNEQLNRVKVSDVEGDVNVAGVFVNWTYDEAHNVDEINMAMTGDMIIRIAEGVVVQKGDLLMSAGDGTAKPQGDDIVRSKTIAKVTSNHVTCTYADGSYCVPCVLMAC
jgi:hypothetical protein